MDQSRPSWSALHGETGFAGAANEGSLGKAESGKARRKYCDGASQEEPWNENRSLRDFIFLMVNNDPSKNCSKQEGMTRVLRQVVSTGVNDTHLSEAPNMRCTKS
jgi:hypothetical protein